MASIVNRPDGHRWIQFVDPHSKRQTLRLGKATAKFAKTVCGRVESLLAARIANTALDGETASWLSVLDGKLRKRLVVLGLAEKPVEVEEGPRLEKFLDGYIAGRKDLKPSMVTVLKQTRRCLISYFGADKQLGGY